MAGLFPGVGRLVVALVEGVAGKGERERGLALAGAGGEDDHFARLPAGGHFVELVEAGGNAVEVALSILEGLDEREGAIDLVAAAHGGVGEALVGDLKDGAFGAVEDRRHRVGHVGDVLHDGGAGELKAAEEGLVLDDLDVGPNVEVGGEADKELGEDTGAANGVGQLSINQPTGESSSRRWPARSCTFRG